jgi:transposase
MASPTLERGGWLPPRLRDEGSSFYGAAHTRELQDGGFTVVEVNRTDRSVKRQLGKEDAITAEAAARAYLAGTATATPKTEDSSMEGKTCAIN